MDVTLKKKAKLHIILKGEVRKMLIGTINLHGGIISELNLLRLPKILKDKYKNDYVEYLRKGIVKMINNKGYDIIACQEMPYEYFSKIQDELDIIEYKIYPEIGYFKYAQCISTFIVKIDLNCKSIDLESGNDYKNKFSKILVRDDIEIVNVHSPKERDVCEQIVNNLNINNKIILLGDFNAAKENQVIDSSKRDDKINVENKRFIEAIEMTPDGIKNFYEIGTDDQYTYFTTKVKNKIDHVFFSKGLYNYLNSAEVILNKNINVNFSEDIENGFTDHSMLEFNIDLEY